MDFASSTRAAESGLGGKDCCKVICGAQTTSQCY